MVMCACKKCSYEWDYTGKNIVTKCPNLNCKCYANIKKSSELYNKIHGSVSAETVTPLETVQKTSDVAADSNITIEDVKVTVPDGLKQEIKSDAVAPQGRAITSAVEIPYKTVEVLCELPFGLWANLISDDEMKLTRTELDSMAPLVKAYLDKNAGGWFAQYSSEIALAIVMGMILLRRATIMAKKGKFKKQQKEFPMDNPNNPELKPDWIKDKKGG